MHEKFQMIHPDPHKKNVNIDKSKYDYVKKAVLELLKKHTSLTPTELFELMSKHYADDFDGKVTWYTEGVKLDLEARKVIAHDRKTRQITLL